MKAAVTKESGMRVAQGMASQREWVRCSDEIHVKVLEVDEPNHSVEFLIRITAG